jgi:uncharacterized protein YbdZ (MbtH family)
MSGEGEAQRGAAGIDGDSFLVLVNDEGQHSIWPAGLAVPDGWSRAAGPASKPDCLAFVETNWTDMRPRSLNAGAAN